MSCRPLGPLVIVAMVLLVAPLATKAQHRGQLPRVGVLEPSHPQSAADTKTCHHGFRQGLRDLGYVDGHNIHLDSRYAEGQPDRLSIVAAELVQLAPDVLWTHSLPAARVLKQATTTIPIVVGVAVDLVEQGLVGSLARPGGNLTGLELRDVELLGKRLELLKDAVPTIARVAVLVDPAERSHTHVPGTIAAEARALGVQLQRVEANTPTAFEGAFAAMVQGGADALLIMDSALLARHRQQLLALARQHRLPTMAGGRHFAEAGSLVAYGAYPRDLCQRSAGLVDKILKGATPAELPVEQGDKFYLVVNLQTAAALGVTLPPTFLFRADEVLR
jgi:putative tryptophan/tyrosine transport system substrate-binding protein